MAAVRRATAALRLPAAAPRLATRVALLPVLRLVPLLAPRAALRPAELAANVTGIAEV